jgi:SnoaL-like protein
VRELLDIEAIKRLKARYFRLLDLKAWDEFERLFTSDFTFLSVHAVGTVPTTPVATSAKAFVARIVAMTDGCTTTHHGHMPEIDVSGDTAHGIWAMQDVVEHPSDAGMRFVGTGHYHDDYERGADALWRIKRSLLVRLRLDPLPSREVAAVAALRVVEHVEPT